MSKEIVINFDKLEKEVHKAVLADEKYSRENDAKFRAIEQRAATYEDFRQIVLASNLKPLDKGETLRSVSVKNTWNLIATNQNPNDENRNKSKIEPVNLARVVPKTNLEFVQLWRKIGNFHEKQWEFIANIGYEKLIELFMVEINGDMLGKFLSVFYNQVKDTKCKNDCDFLVKLLNGFPKCNRFELNFLFLQKSEVELCKKLFEIFIEFYKSNENETNIDLNVLKSKYFK
jgi:hypothetical protein